MKFSANWQCEKQLCQGFPAAVVLSENTIEISFAKDLAPCLSVNENDSEGPGLGALGEGNEFTTFKTGRGVAGVTRLAKIVVTLSTSPKERWFLAFSRVMFCHLRGERIVIIVV